MILVCSITIAIVSGGINFLTKADVEGQYLAESATKYLVDFRRGVQKYPIQGKAEDYSQILVVKDECVKLKGLGKKK